MTDSLSKPILTSLCLHVAMVAFFTVRAIFFPSQPIHLRQAIRVDIVGLPQKEQVLPVNKPVAETKPAPAPTPKEATLAKPKQVAEPPPPKGPTLALKHPAKPDNSANAQKKALSEIKAMAALEKFKNEVAQAKPKPVAGNKVAAGDALTGLEKIDYDRYFKELEDQIRENWSLPQWLVDAHLRAQAQVLIDPTGAIRKKPTIVKSSGNSEFDDLVLQAIDKSAPFPPPPERLQDVLSQRGIVFNFPQRSEE